MKRKITACLSLLFGALILLSSCQGNDESSDSAVSSASSNYSSASSAPVKTSADAAAKPTDEPATEKETATDAATEEATIEVRTVETKPFVMNNDRSDPDDVNDATGFVSVSDVIPDVVLDMRYYSSYNFAGTRVNGYEEPVALLTKEAARALKNAADSLRTQGYRIKIYDAYRPQTAVDHFASWASDPDDDRMKKDFYPDLDKSVLFDYGYIAYYSGHSRGCTVDMTICDMSGNDIDMGGTFDYFGEISHPDYTGITNEQYNNRMLLRNTMTNSGFRPCSTEWWDFTLIDEPYPNTYFTFPVSTKSLTKNG